MTYRIPDGRDWLQVDASKITELASRMTNSHLMRSEPNNSGCTFEVACDVLRRVAERPDDVSDIFPDHLE